MYYNHDIKKKGRYGVLLLKTSYKGNMLYFEITIDKNYTHIPRISNWYGTIDTRNLKQGSYEKVSDRFLLNVEHDNEVIYTNIITTPFLMVSVMLRNLFELFEPNLQFKKVILLDRNQKAMNEYYLPQLAEVECLTSNCKYNFNHSELIHIELDESKIKDKCIFYLAGIEKHHVIARQDVVESMLNRNVKGLWIKEIQSVKGEGECQKRVKTNI